MYNLYIITYIYIVYNYIVLYNWHLRKREFRMLAKPNMDKSKSYQDSERTDCTECVLSPTGEMLCVCSCNTVFSLPLSSAHPANATEPPPCICSLCVGCRKSSCKSDMFASMKVLSLGTQTLLSRPDHCQIHLLWNRHVGSAEESCVPVVRLWGLGRPRAVARTGASCPSITGSRCHVGWECSCPRVPSLPVPWRAAMAPTAITVGSLHREVEGVWFHTAETGRKPMIRRDGGGGEFMSSRRWGWK